MLWKCKQTALFVFARGHYKLHANYSLTVRDHVQRCPMFLKMHANRAVCAHSQVWGAPLYKYLAADLLQKNVTFNIRRAICSTNSIKKVILLYWFCTLGGGWGRWGGGARRDGQEEDEAVPTAAWTSPVVAGENNTICVSLLKTVLTYMLRPAVSSAILQEPFKKQ